MLGVFFMEEVKYNNSNVPFEPLFELIHTNINEVWEMYQKSFTKKMNWLAYTKSFETQELISECYLWFVKYSKVYNPYYNYGFIPFSAYIYKKVMQRMLAYCQQNRFKMQREQATDFSLPANESTNYSGRDSIMEMETFENNVDIYKSCKMPCIEDVDFEIAKQELYNYLTPRDIEIIEMRLQGMKQQEIAKKLNIKQSAVSLIISRKIKMITKQIYGQDVNKETRKKLDKYKKMREKNQLIK